MRRNILWALAAFAVVLLAHAGFTIWRAQALAEHWVQVGGGSPFVMYLAHQDYLLGASYGLAAAFTVYSLLRVRQRRRAGARGAVAGLSLAGILCFPGCWLVGCCGSPLLPVYLSLFGASFLGVIKPLVFGLTLASVGLGLWWVERKPRTASCGCGDSGCGSGCDGNDEKATDTVHAELAEGMNLPKCRKCGCMKETLEQLAVALPSVPAGELSELRRKLPNWQRELEPLQYACLGCPHCYPAAAVNAFHQAFPDTANPASLNCGFEVRPDTWPPVPGEYFATCEGESCPVAVSTLASPGLSEALFKHRPRELCIAGKTETENIGIDKLIQNTIANRTIRFLVVAGREPIGHETGRTLLALAANGVDENMRVIGSPGRRPVLRNIDHAGVETFRRQVQVVDLVGCEDVEQIVHRVKKLAETVGEPCGCSDGCSETAAAPASNPPVVQAEPPARVEMDKAGYFVILPRADQGVIWVEHYAYDNQLLHVIEGRDARSLYWTLIQSGWVSQLSHAAYLGKELARAELSLQHGFKFVQDGA